MSNGLDLAVYETFEDNFGRKASLEEVVQEISQFSLSSLLWVCATIVTGLQLWDRGEPPLEVYSDLLKLFFPHNLVTRFQIGFWSKDPRREVFHRRQILLIAKLGIPGRRGPRFNWQTQSSLCSRTRAFSSDWELTIQESRKYTRSL